LADIPRSQRNPRAVNAVYNNPLATPPHLVIGTPCYGRQVTDAYAGSLLKLQAACIHGGIRLQVLMTGSDALITRARQNIVAQFLGNAEATHLLFIDADIGFEPDQVFRLLEFDADMSAAVYPIKRLDWDKIAAAAKAGLARLDRSSLSYMVQFPSSQQLSTREGFVRVGFAGSGFLMIRRAALVSMTERYPELRYAYDHKHNDRLAGSPWRYALFNCMIDPESGVYLSEDYSFCRRWTDMGGEIWADLNSRLQHVGAVTFDGDFSTQFQSAPPLADC
jgi:hypothetical protein